MEQQDTKRRILTEALKLFSTNGYEAVSVEQIARAVGIKAPSLYKHYKSKRDIFDNIIVSMNEMDLERAKEYEMPEGTMEEVAEAYQLTPPVSYTHLDVYKRQVMDIDIGGHRCKGYD